MCAAGASGVPLARERLDVADVDLRVLNATGEVNPLLCSCVDILVAVPPIGKERIRTDQSKRKEKGEYLEEILKRNVYIQK